MKAIFNFLKRGITAVKARLRPILQRWVSRFKFPHFPRKLTAALPSWQAKKVISLFLLLILLFNLGESFIFPFNEEKRLRYQLMRQPAEFGLHEKLGQYYLKVNSAAAEKEYLLAEEFYLTLPAEESNGESPWQRWIAINLEKQKLKDEMLFWEEVCQATPDYQYAPFKLAALYFQLGDKSKAREYLEKVREEWPTDKAIWPLAERLK